jgi:hypothetical protein
MPNNLKLYTTKLAALYASCPTSIQQDFPVPLRENETRAPQDQPENQTLAYNESLKLKDAYEAKQN